MKLIHLSDLHIGKRVHEVSMIDDQIHILDQIIRVIDDEQPQAVLMAGDIYDKSIPSAEAVALLDDFLSRLARRKLQIFIISGNHDSPERLAFGNRLMTGAGVHVSPVYGGAVAPITLTDEYGPVHFYLLPFIKPAHVRHFCPDAQIESYTDACRVAVEQMAVDTAARNVLLTHQFVTGASRCESEDISVGGSDNVDAAVFVDFDYVALGHIHGPQNIGSPRIRYCGTPLKYSFSEADQEKSVTVVELGEKGSLEVRTVPLVPRRDMRQLRGSYAALIQGPGSEDYLHIILTDEEDVFEAMSHLREVYPNAIRLTYDNTRTRSTQTIGRAEDIRHKSPLELFSEFYELQNNKPMSDVQTKYIRELMESIWEGSQ